MKLKRAAVVASLLALCAEAQAAPLFLYPGADLSLGEVAVFTPGLPGYVDVNAATGALQVQNAAVILAPSRGDFIVEGNELSPIILTVVAGAPVCDVTYLNPCLGAPTITVTHTFPGYITGNYCPKHPKCQDTIYVGGRFAFTGTEEGRWTSTVTITANYQ